MVNQTDSEFGVDLRLVLRIGICEDLREIPEARDQMTEFLG
jgi:hypothetical protein